MERWGVNLEPSPSPTSVSIPFNQCCCFSPIILVTFDPIENVACDHLYSQRVPVIYKLGRDVAWRPGDNHGSNHDNCKMVLARVCWWGLPVIPGKTVFLGLIFPSFGMADTMVQ